MDLEEEGNMLMILAMHAKRPKHDGSVFDRRKLWRKRIEGHNKLIRPKLWLKHIFKEVTKHDRFFEQRRNACGELGHSTYQKVTAALRMLAYGIPADLVDDHLAMDESQQLSVSNTLQ
jgi:hypothetical protein